MSRAKTLAGSRRRAARPSEAASAARTRGERERGEPIKSLHGVHYRSFSVAPSPQMWDVPTRNLTGFAVTPYVVDAECQPVWGILANRILLCGTEVHRVPRAGFKLLP